MAEKCANPPCGCKVRKQGEFGNYCSPACQKKGKATAPACICGHTDCRLPVTSAIAKESHTRA